jgi:TLC domain
MKCWNNMLQKCKKAETERRVGISRYRYRRVTNVFVGNGKRKKSSKKKNIQKMNLSAMASGYLKKKRSSDVTKPTSKQQSMPVRTRSTSRRRKVDHGDKQNNHYDNETVENATRRRRQCHPIRSEAHSHSDSPSDSDDSSTGSDNNNTTMKPLHSNSTSSSSLSSSSPKSHYRWVRVPSLSSYGWQCDNVGVKQLIFLFSVLAIMPFTFTVLNNISMTVIKRQHERPDYDYPKLSDLWICVWSTIFFIVFRIVSATYLFKPLASVLLEPTARKRNWTPQDRHQREERFGAVCFKLLYFCCITPLGFYVLKDADWFPPSLGGSGDTENIFKGFPFQPYVPLLKEYYMIELGYHTHSLLYHMALEHRSDYLEMMLHHCCAVFLVVFSYYENLVRVGSLVLIVHDIADVTAYLIKTAVDTVYTKVTLSLYAALLVNWAYTRFYVFPFVIIKAIYETEAMETIPAEHFDQYEWTYLVNLLQILVVLHVYWYYLFLYIGYKYATTGIAQDLQQKVGGEVEVEVEVEMEDRHGHQGTGTGSTSMTGRSRAAAQTPTRTRTRQSHRH